MRWMFRLYRRKVEIEVLEIELREYERRLGVKVRTSERNTESFWQGRLGRW